jgi:DNA repair photolyase
MRRLHIEEIQCKTILNKSVMDFSDYTLNAYQGCAFACSYCYVPAMRARRGQVDDHAWGGWVQVKVNAPDVLRRQMLRVEPHEKIAIGTATDSWQPLEKKYRIARAILQELSYYPNAVSLLTRSPLLLRDLDLLRQIERLSVGVSLPTFDDRVRRVFEPFAPAVRGRVRLIEGLVSAGITPSLFWAPMLPGIADNARAVRDYLENAARLGVRRVLCLPFRYTDTLGAPHMRLLKLYREKESPAPVRTLPHWELAKEVEQTARRLGIEAALGA